jgi:hypothetical protein
MKRLFAALSLALLLSLAVCVGVAGAQGQGGNDSATGSVSTVSTPSGFRLAANISFSAKSSSIGTNASGRYRHVLTDTDPNGVITGEVRCLRVSGRLFEARGVVTDVRNAPGFSNIQGFYIHGSDDGKFSNVRDTFDWTYFSNPQTETSCLLPTPGFFEVVNGDITVHDAP